MFRSLLFPFAGMRYMRYAFICTSTIFLNDKLLLTWPQPFRCAFSFTDCRLVSDDIRRTLSNCHVLNWKKLKGDIDINICFVHDTFALIFSFSQILSIILYMIDTAIVTHVIKCFFFLFIKWWELLLFLRLVIILNIFFGSNLSLKSPYCLSIEFLIISNCYIVVL